MIKRVLRQATLADAEAIANVYITCRKELLAFAPLTHSDENIKRWIHEALIPNEMVIVAEENQVIIGMMSFTNTQDMGRINQLYVHPSFVGRGIGTLMIKLAKSMLGSPIQLYTFQQNTGAIRFYERNGFRAIAFSDGSDNEESCPAILYEWNDTNDYHTNGDQR
jgi:ribosomal protein S18 acetylase RimI-like enzyme